MEITRLVKRAKRKDADAFTELMESQMQNMYKVARSILLRDEDVADAISDLNQGTNAMSSAAMKM